MQTERLNSKHGYEIPTQAIWSGEERVVIACHGFGSSKASPMIQALNQALPSKGCGVVSFDFPAHGESPVWQEGLRVPYCIDDLAVVEDYVRAQRPQAKIGYFGSSFGAYITLLYLSQAAVHGERAFLRSAAVDMPALVDTWVDQKAREDMARQGYFVPDYDYVREMRVTPAFLQDLEAYNVFERYKAGTAALSMVHGGQDSVAPYQAAQTFAAASGADFHTLPQGEHNLMGEGELEQVLAWSSGFLLAD